MRSPGGRGLSEQPVGRASLARCQGLLPMCTFQDVKFPWVFLSLGVHVIKR